MATQLDLEDPRITSTYNDIRSGTSTTDWMILAVAPQLPGQKKDMLSVLGSGSGGLEEFQQQAASFATTGYGYLKHDNKLVFIEIVPEQLSGAQRTVARKYGKQISSVLKDFDTSLTITSGSELLESPVFSPSVDAIVNANRKRAPSETSNTAQSPLFPGKSALSTSSLTSDADLLAEESLRKIKENTQARDRAREDANRKLKAILEQRQVVSLPRENREQQWAKEKETRERQLKDTFKAEYQAFEESTRKDHVLGAWADQMTSDGKFWRRRWIVIQGTSMKVFADGASIKPLATIDLKQASIRDSQDIYYLPYTFTLRDAVGKEHTLHSGDARQHLQTVAAVERNVGRALMT
ncbi:hypothetical protein HKX48_005544 [Thoreauomyces humboldtii]|nr:hypothetical protein HKX48_005544 [Thoreauomyces humboldtii]